MKTKITWDEIRAIAKPFIGVFAIYLALAGMTGNPIPNYHVYAPYTWQVKWGLALLFLYGITSIIRAIELIFPIGD